jgi:hypothetical protein
MWNESFPTYFALPPAVTRNAWHALKEIGIRPGPRR